MKFSGVCALTIVQLLSFLLKEEGTGGSADVDPVSYITLAEEYCLNHVPCCMHNVDPKP